MPGTGPDCHGQAIRRGPLYWLRLSRALFCRAPDPPSAGADLRRFTRRRPSKAASNGGQRAPRHAAAKAGAGAAGAAPVWGFAPGAHVPASASRWPGLAGACCACCGALWLLSHGQSQHSGRRLGYTSRHGGAGATPDERGCAPFGRPCHSWAPAPDAPGCCYTIGSWTASSAACRWICHRRTWRHRRTALRAKPPCGQCQDKMFGGVGRVQRSLEAFSWEGATK